MKMTAAVLREYCEPLTIEEVDLLPPRAGEVMVKYEATGICHSDLWRAQGKRVSVLPLVLGHEGAGEIVEVGSDVSHLHPGDRVAVTTVCPCGKCFYCDRGEWHLCTASARLLNSAAMLDGTTRLRAKDGQEIHHYVVSSFAQYAVMPATCAIKIPQQMSLRVAALLGCGVLTGVGLVFNKAKVKPGSTCAIIGTGGIGLNAIQACALSGARKVVAVDINTERLELARTFGATHTINTMEEDAIAVIRGLTDGEGVDYSFEAVGNVATMRQAFDAVRRGGICTVVGVASVEAQLVIPAQELTIEDKVLQGAMAPFYPQRDIPILCDLYLEGKLKLDELITRNYQLTEINDAFKDMEEGKLARGLLAHSTL